MYTSCSESTWRTSLFGRRRKTSNVALRMAGDARATGTSPVILPVPPGPLTIVNDPEPIDWELDWPIGGELPDSSSTHTPEVREESLGHQPHHRGCVCARGAGG